MTASTRDPGEVAKFAALAAQWWDPKGPFGALHRLNPVRLSFIRDTATAHFGCGAPRPLAGLEVLDIGCGGGLASAPLARLGARVTGIDAASETVGAAAAYAAQCGLDIDFRCTVAEELAAGGARYDLVTALEIVEHVADLGLFLTAAATLTKPGGLLIVSTINRTAKARALAIVGAERVLKWAPAGAHEYEKLVTPEEIRVALPELHWDEPVGMVYNPLGRGWTLSRDIDVNYLMAGRKAGALRSRA
jgi:2-polyprenyl-6-hydroxyphenyl methylase/3-demethylubiquinone-9 3-methyltransferase